jgi:sugar phosphate isomerase/epimerase
VKIGVFSDPLFKLSLREFLDAAAAIGLDYVEFGTGCWSASPHLNLEQLLQSARYRESLLAQLSERKLKISALNCSGNPLHPGEAGRQHDDITRKTIALAEMLDVDRVVMMSGCPAAPGDKVPNWITVSWPPELTRILEWQWTDVIIPYWKELAALAVEKGRRLCLELHGHQSVYNVESFLRLRDAVGATVGVNFDPSHLFWMGADPLTAIRALGDTIYHAHAKDVRIELQNASRNGLLDAKPVLPVEPRSWNFVSVGKGHDATFWKAFVSTLQESGYDDVLSIEHEDYSTESTEDILLAVKSAKSLIETKPSARAS